MQLPDNVETLGDSAFIACTNLASINLPEKIDRLSSGLFKNCKSLPNMEIPSRIGMIGSYTFAGCEGMTEINIPSGIVRLYDGVADGCTNLQKISLPRSLMWIGNNAFRNCSSLTEIALPDEVTEIGAYAFEGCNKLTSLTIPDGVASIGRNCFSGCTELSEITLPEALTYLNFQTFGNCTKLEKIKLPYNLAGMDYRVFEGCTALSTVYIPSRTLETRSNIFQGCPAIAEVWFNTETPTILEFESAEKPVLHVPYGDKDAWAAQYPGYELKECGTIHINKADEYATDFISTDFIMPEGMTGYLVSDVSGDSRTLYLDEHYPAGSNVPASTGLIVKGGGTAMFDVEAQQSAQSEATNLLRGTDRKEMFENIPGERYYRMTRNDNNQLGFFYGESSGKAFENSAHEAYLAVPVAKSSFFGFLMDDAESAAISAPTISDDGKIHSVHTLNGISLKVENRSQLTPGIYIINGKKEVIK